MSKAIKFNEIHKLVPGITIFEVIVGSRLNRCHPLNINDISELNLTTAVYNNPLSYESETLWIDSKVTFVSHAGLICKNSHISTHSLRDRGIARDGSIYNLNRFFWTKEDAEEFIVEVNQRIFTSEQDQQFYEKRDSTLDLLTFLH